jgi:hypothetical protein
MRSIRKSGLVWLIVAALLLLFSPLTAFADDLLPPINPPPIQPPPGSGG